MTALPSYIDPELWSAFVESRKAMKVPFTPAAQKLVVRKLMKMHADGWDANASLEKSAIYGYRGVFEVAKRAQEPQKQQPAYQVSDEHLARSTGPSPEIRQKIKELTRPKVFG